MGSGYRAQASERRAVARAGQVARRLARCLEALGRRAGQLCAGKLARGDTTEKGGAHARGIPAALPLRIRGSKPAEAQHLGGEKVDPQEPPGADTRAVESRR